MHFDPIADIPEEQPEKEELPVLKQSHRLRNIGFGLVTAVFVLLVAGGFVLLARKPLVPINGQAVRQANAQNQASEKATAVPSSGTIAFVIDSTDHSGETAVSQARTNKDDIYFVNPDGTGKRRVISNPVDSHVAQLRWSSKGKYLTWMRNGNLEYAGSSNLSRSAVATIEFDTRDYDVSPDETKIVVVEYGASTESQTGTLRIIDLKTKRELKKFERAVDAKDLVDGNVHWTDNEHVIVATTDDETIENSTTKLTEFTMSQTGAAGRVLTSFQSAYGAFTLSPSFDKVVYTFVVSQGKPNPKDPQYGQKSYRVPNVLGIYEMNLNGLKKYQVLTDEDFGISDMSYSPDGNFVAYKIAKQPVGPGERLHIANLTSGRTVNTDCYCNNYAWKPDSSGVIGNNTDDSAALDIVGLDGKTERTILGEDKTKKADQSIYTLAVFPVTKK